MAKLTKNVNKLMQKIVLSDQPQESKGEQNEWINSHSQIGRAKEP